MYASQTLQLGCVYGLSNSHDDNGPFTTVLWIVFLKIVMLCEFSQDLSGADA